MASTGEVACFGRDVEEAFYASWQATEQRVAGKSVFISIPNTQKHKFVDETRALVQAGWRVYTTAGTQDYMWERGVKTHRLHKLQEKKSPSAETVIEARKLDLVICVPSSSKDTTDAYRIRRLAIDNHVPLITNAETGRLLLRCLADEDLQAPQPKAWDEYVPNFTT
jgi:carbamoyl-phosphate synthase large subunit